MKAIVYTKYGPPDVLEYKEVAKPTPTEDEVLIKVYAASVTFGDAAVVRQQDYNQKSCCMVYNQKIMLYSI